MRGVKRTLRKNGSGRLITATNSTVEKGGKEDGQKEFLEVGNRKTMMTEMKLGEVLPEHCREEFHHPLGHGKRIMMVASISMET